MAEQDIELRRTRDLERYHRRTAERRARGVCLKCGKRPPTPGRTQCEPCAAKKRPADRARHHRRTAERVARGLCPKCGKVPPAPERSQCEPCLEKDRTAGRARDARLSTAGIPRRDPGKAREYERKRAQIVALYRIQIAHQAHINPPVHRNQTEPKLYQLLVRGPILDNRVLMFGMPAHSSPRFAASRLTQRPFTENVPDPVNPTATPLAWPPESTRTPPSNAVCSTRQGNIRKIGYPLRSPIRSRSVLKTHKKTPMYGLISTHSYRIGNKGKFHNHES